MKIITMRGIDRPGTAPPRGQPEQQSRFGTVGMNDGDPVTADIPGNPNDLHAITREGGPVPDRQQNHTDPVLLQQFYAVGSLLIGPERRGDQVHFELFRIQRQRQIDDMPQHAATETLYAEQYRNPFFHTLRHIIAPTYG